MNITTSTQSFLPDLKAIEEDQSSLDN